MVLGGVIVLRRSKVEHEYERLRAPQQLAYRALHPVCQAVRPAEGGAAPAAGGSPPGACSVRRRGSAGGAEPEPLAEADGPLQLSAQQHRDIWDVNGLHYCDDAAVQTNRVLHLGVCPALLSIFVGCAWARYFDSSYVRSVLGAAVLFFTMLGPVTARILYFGSQGIFLQASRLNHSCAPNAEWLIDGQRAPLGGPAWGLPGDEGAAQRAGVAASSLSLSLRAKRDVGAGEEITIDARRFAQARSGRGLRRVQQRLAGRASRLLEYGFWCSCELCAAAVGRAAEVDEQEEEE
ncbi:unnamed protein product [Prorocentrum cordatum]|uniref:SET domain-containing protein n=1 Tax=Prorocentrum cordatum TaxID=2364126 RepID=A0ABN9SZG3_9DINO|nr:unnamed protein product [Polarella glacialis]